MVKAYFTEKKFWRERYVGRGTNQATTQKAADAHVIRDKTFWKVSLCFAQPLVGDMRFLLWGHCVEVFFRVAMYDVHIAASDKKITMEKVRVQ